MNRLGRIDRHVRTTEEITRIAESDELRELVGADLLFQVQMLILEAGNNALAVSEKGSDIQVTSTAEAVIVSVTDYGPGFSYPGSLEQQKRYLRHNPLSTSGRGLVLIASLADEVVYTDRQELVMRVFAT